MAVGPNVSPMRSTPDTPFSTVRRLIMPEGTPPSCDVNLPRSTAMELPSPVSLAKDWGWSGVTNHDPLSTNRLEGQSQANLVTK